MNNESSVNYNKLIVNYNNIVEKFIQLSMDIHYTKNKNWNLYYNNSYTYEITILTILTI